MTGNPAADVFSGFVYGLVPLAALGVLGLWCVRAVRRRRG